MLLVVRHADADDKSTWEGPDHLRPLSPSGHLQAEGKDASPAQLPTLFWDRELRSSVLCTHGEGIGLLLTRLIARRLVVEDPLDWPKGSTWLLERTQRRQVRGRFLAPLVISAARTPWVPEGFPP